MIIFNIISGICSILGLVAALFVASKVTKISASNNNNSGIISQGDGKHEIASHHSATGNARVIHEDYRKAKIYGKVDKLPILSDDSYVISAENVLKYYNDLSDAACKQIDVENSSILMLSADFASEQFYENKTQFIGFAVQSLPMRDWRSFVNEGFCFLFDYEKTGSINSINIEFTNKQLNKKIKNEHLELDANGGTYRLDLKSFSQVLEDWKSVDEICCVFFLNECAHTYGTVKLSSMRIIKQYNAL